MSKSGQFILHTWLPDAMAGPTPVSALIHAATMVVAGVYMVARLYPVFFDGPAHRRQPTSTSWPSSAASPSSSARSLAFVQTDIKKVLAYSTISQLGYMVMALGVGAWTGAIFHLFTHAFFKACLFLGAGSVSHAAPHLRHEEGHGRPAKYMPKTFWTFIIGTGALIGIFPLAGFWSKDEILAGRPRPAAAGGYKLMLVMGLIGAFMTAAYMTRGIWLTFFGEYAARHGPPRTSRPAHHRPAVILAGAAPSSPASSTSPTSARSAPAYTHRASSTSSSRPAPTSRTIDHGRRSTSAHRASPPSRSAVLGIGLAYLWYWKRQGPARHHRAQQGRPAPGYTVLENKYYLDPSTPTSSSAASRARSPRPPTGSTRTSSTASSTAPASAPRRPAASSTTTSTRASSTRIVNGSGAGAEGIGPGPAPDPDRQGAAVRRLLFAGAAILAGIFVIVA